MQKAGKPMRKRDSHYEKKADPTHYSPILLTDFTHRFYSDFTHPQNLLKIIPILTKSPQNLFKISSKYPHARTFFLISKKNSEKSETFENLGSLCRHQENMPEALQAAGIKTRHIQGYTDLFRTQRSNGSQVYG